MPPFDEGGAPRSEFKIFVIASGNHSKIHRWLRKAQTEGENVSPPVMSFGMTAPSDEGAFRTLNNHLSSQIINPLSRSSARISAFSSCRSMGMQAP